jgi:hypothetical protein
LKSSTILVVSLLIIALALVEAGLVFASSAPEYYGGTGGTISGIVVNPNGSVVDWAQIYARSGNQTFEAFSGFSGFYSMRVPAGTYNVSVYDFYNPTYWAPSANVTVTDGSLSTANFYLQPQPPAAVPEFQPNILAFVCMLAIVGACVGARRMKKPSGSL